MGKFSEVGKKRREIADRLKTELDVYDAGRLADAAERGDTDEMARIAEGVEARDRQAKKKK